jgi:hypothetical protein
VPGLDYGSHSALLVHPLPWYGHGSGWRGRRRISTLTGVESPIFLESHLDQVADPMIEATELARSMEGMVGRPMYGVKP